MRKQLRSFTPRPKDFSDFWRKTLQELDDVPFGLTREAVGSGGSTEPSLEHIAFDSLWGGRIHGYFLKPAGGQD